MASSAVYSSATDSCLTASTGHELRVLIIETGRKVGIDLKEKQLEAIQMFCSGNDVFVSLPTGYGKSMIYGLLPLVYNTLKG